ncbi:MAG: dihydroorotase [Arcobacteraceae bacterium]
MSVLLKNIRIIDAYTDRVTNILIDKDNFIKFENNTNDTSAMEIITGENLGLFPSFIDLHCHLRDPGYTYKEDLESGQQAALAGGFTTICCMANTLPVCDNPETINYIINKAQKLALCNVIPVSAVTYGLDTTNLVDFEKMITYTRLFSNDGIPIKDENTMIKALQASTKYNFKILTHCEPETEIITRDLELLKLYGGNLHICHVSKKDSLQIIRKAKSKGLEFSCEVTPHHLFSYDLDYMVHPPFRKKEDAEALLEGLLDGTVDIIATDHAPHSSEDKLKGARGLIEFDHAFSLVYTLFKKYNISIQLLSKLMSEKPAKLLGIEKTSFLSEIYSKANFVLIDLSKKYEINRHTLHSKAGNTPFLGQVVYGKILMTFKEGKIKYDNR